MLRDIYLTLLASLDQINGDTVEGAFAMWMSADILDMPKERFPIDFAVTNYHDVARLAFVTELDPQAYLPYHDQLAEGLSRVAGRTITVLHEEPAPFRSDAVALLGLALGAKRVGGEVQSKVLEWMKTFVIPTNNTLPGWKRLFLILALRFSGDLNGEQSLQGITEVEDLKVAFEKKGIIFLEAIDLNRAYQMVVHSSMSEGAELPIVACRVAALHHLSLGLPTISLSKPTDQELMNMLGNLPSAFKRWPWEEKAKTSTGTAQKWDLQNEYHVQSIIYFLLAPIFQDIEHEFYLDPTGQLNARADLGIPSLNLIIEIKFLRDSISFAKMIEEVAADASLYFKKDSVYSKKYFKMIVFLWDNSSRIQEHHEFKKGVSKLQNVVGCVVATRPGNMPIAKRSSKKRGL